MHISAPLSGQAQRLAEHIGQGEGLRAVPVKLLPARFQKMRTIANGELRRDCTTLYHRLDPKRPSYTTAQQRCHDPEEHVRLEVARRNTEAGRRRGALDAVRRLLGNLS
jgi:hypothetical protein